MKKNIFIIIALIGFVGLFSNCEKDGTELTMKESVTAPVLQLPADLALTRANGTNVLTFVGTPVDPGFAASATYYLEACPEGDDFENVTELYNGATCTAIEFTENELNQKLLDAFPEDATSPIDFRLRSVLTVDAGTGALGTGSDPFEYISTTQSSDVTLYGLLRLDLIGSGLTQKIVSSASDGKYEGLVKLDPAQAFTLLNPETSTSYGGSGGTLTVDGAGIVVSNAGWHLLSADIEGLAYDPTEYFIALVGSAVTGDDTGWENDQKMEYDPETKQWSITIDLYAGACKFRRNGGWDWNMGFPYEDGTDPVYPGPEGATQKGGVGNDFPIEEAGNYTFILNIYTEDTGYYQIIKN